MKKILIYTLAAAFALPAFSQEESKMTEKPEKTRVSIGENEIIIVEDNGDTTRLQLGKKGMSIVEGKDGYTIDIVDMENDDKDSSKKDDSDKKRKFKPNYAGVELGLNNYVNSDYSLHTGTFMNLNTAKSWNVNLNFLEYGIGLGTKYVGLVTGMGIEWSNYVFDNHNSISEINGNIEERVLTYPDISKSKLLTTYLTAPLLLEFHIPAGKKNIHISGGLIGAVKTGSRTKVKFNDGEKQKEVLKNDYSLSPFRYGATIRVGYRAINIFANYYFTPLFGESPTPELYPFSIGLTLLEF